MCFEGRNCFVMLVEFLKLISRFSYISGLCIYLHDSGLATSIEDAGAECQSVDIANGGFQTPDQLSSFEIPDIDLAVKAPTVEERAFTGQ